MIKIGQKQMNAGGAVKKLFVVFFPFSAKIEDIERIFEILFGKCGCFLVEQVLSF